MDATANYIGYIMGIHFTPGATTICVQTQETSFTCLASPRLVQQALLLRDGLIQARILSGPPLELIEISQAGSVARPIETPMILPRSVSEIPTIDLG